MDMKSDECSVSNIEEIAKLIDNKFRKLCGTHFHTFNSNSNYLIQFSSHLHEILSGLSPR